MTREYVRAHVETVAKVFCLQQPTPEEVIDIITNKLMEHPAIQAGDELALGAGCRFYVKEVNDIIRKES